MKALTLPKLQFLVFLLFFSFSIFSCSEDPVEETSETKGETSIEETKDNLDDNLVEIANNVENFLFCESMTYLNSVEIPYILLDSILLFDPNAIDLTVLKVESAIKDEIRRVTLSEEIKWGTFSYNFETSEYDYEAGEIGTLIINSPSSQEIPSNDLEVVLHIDFNENTSFDLSDGINFGGSPIGDDILPDIILEDFIDSAELSIKRNDENILDFNCSVGLINYNIPNSFTSTLQIEEFLIEINAEANNTEASQSLYFSNDEKTILGYTIALNGDLSKERIAEMLEEAGKFYNPDEVPDIYFLINLEYEFIVDIQLNEYLISGVVDSEQLIQAIAIGAMSSDLERYCKALDDAMKFTLKDPLENTVGVSEIYVLDNQISYGFRFTDGTLVDFSDQYNFAALLPGFIERFLELKERLNIDTES